MTAANAAGRRTQATGAEAAGDGGGRPGLPDSLRREIAEVAAAEGCDLLEAELAGGTLRLILDRPEGGVGLGDCEQVSRQVSALLDVADYGERRYVLEVSSPGLDRKLYGPQDYERFTGSLVRVTHRSAQDHPGESAKRTVVGRLTEFRPAGDSGGQIDLIVQQGKREVRETIPLDSILLARLEIEI